MALMKICVSTAALSCLIAFVSVPLASAQTPGEAFCAENQRHLDRTNGEMPFEIDEAVAWLTQHFNMSETEAVRLIDNVGETHWSGLNGRWEVTCHGQ
ncbi:hypothetical protein BST22_23860 [Mycolicibacterium chubuense]|uniref:Uncharacterized protein n=1 Tax=Mycolicibacterium chubuense TaxID=1800 RepID=A0A0J6WQC4_MYCCU|nr:hypothetical protein [Mycolicibacterium chubuense]KMO84764.1 hypothetical protein MCHUDSM44219_00388 [Mycolicibacterium chubuense]ORA45297.1 hypothetical protein BST22_23860 [Mycolicibacterium chubuense]SPY00826.1 Uncharacterised protein [Mycolicibacterium chubuense]